MLGRSGRDLNRVDEAYTGHAVYVDLNCTIGHCDRKLLVDGRPISRLRDDIEIGQHGRAVDRHVEDPATGIRVLNLGEF